MSTLHPRKYLARVMEIMEQVRDGNRDDTPVMLRQSDLAKAFFGALREQVSDAEGEVGSVQEDQSPYNGQVCIDYVITHEVCHLKHPQHDRYFFNLLDQLCPNWKTIKARLEKL